MNSFCNTVVVIVMQIKLVVVVVVASGLTKFCATRWTVRATCFQRVIDNYDALLKLWNDCLETRLESDDRGRIIGCLKHR